MPVFQMKVFRLLYFALVLLAGTVRGQDQKAASLAFNPQSGETVVFLGDSITHQCLYTQYLEDFFITRYPDRRIQFHNAGVGGDKVGDCLKRFDKDVAAYEPDYVLILLGMNDGQYEDFNVETVATYQQGMTRLLDRIEQIGAKAIVLSPTMFDHGTATRRKEDETWRFQGKEFSPDYNALMAYLGAWCLEAAGKRGLPYVNLWGPLNEHTIAQRRLNPNFSMIEDAIHPQASGQLVMAFEILSQLEVESRGANSISIFHRGEKWIGRGVKDLTVAADAALLSFSHTAKSLPWVIPETEATRELKWRLPSDGRVGYSLTKAGHKLSADRLKIAGLPPGNYQVEIDGTVIGQWGHIALGTKIEIQENEKTPQFQQALKVALMNQKRNDDITRPLRDTWGQIKGAGKAAPDTARAKQLPGLFEEATELARMEAESLAEIYEAAQPVERQWVIRRVE